MRDCNRQHAHFIGICGKAMGGIAAAVASEGWRVTGSDEQCYGPMKNYLQGCGLPIRTPFQARNVPADADLAIVGKRVAANNPELLEVTRRGIPHRSFPQFLREQFLLRSRNAVVTGGVGKTTTTAMLTWILEHNGLRPDYLIGGVARNLSAPARLSGSEFTVLEGDEYSSCFDDRNPKFLHYCAEVGVITNIIEDHPDIYRSFDDLCDAFAAFIETLPASGCLIIPDDDAAATKLTLHATCQVITIGSSRAATRRISDVQLLADRSCFRLQNQDFEIALCGQMNIRNAAMAALAAAHFGVGLARSAAALQLFQGVRKRQEEKPIGNCTLVHDKASHPHALEELARALRQRFPGRRLVSIIQPRATGGKEWIYQRNLPKALSHFDEVVLTSAHEHNPSPTRVWANDPFCLDRLASGLKDRSVNVVIARLLPEIEAAIHAHIRSEDVVVLTVLEQSESLAQAVEKSLREINWNAHDRSVSSDAMLPAA